MTPASTEVPSNGAAEAVLYVVLTAAGELHEMCADGRPDRNDPEDPDYQSVLWTAVHTAIAPGSTAINGIEVPEANMRAKVVDTGVALARPELFPPNPYASAVLTILGLKLEKCLVGTVVIVRQEDVETAHTGSLTQQQLHAIRRAHRAVAGHADEAQRWRFS